MHLRVEIEDHSGFCGGVIRAIGRAEQYLDDNPGRQLWSLGAIVHNEAELKRLGGKGLITISKDDLEAYAGGSYTVPRSESTCTLLRLSGDKGSTLLIRAHGEPPETYSKAEKAGLKVIDCTCPVVIRLQKSIREAHERLLLSGGQLIIFGKIGHAEVLGLLGQAEGDALVVEDLTMLKEIMSNGGIRTDKPIEIFSQTTKSPVEYSDICSALRDAARAGIVIHDTICSQVASRYAELSDFSISHDVIIFVSGDESSNGKVLCELCKTKNPKTHHISNPEEISGNWFQEGDHVGICGATSTPGWLLEKVSEAVSKL